ncbi:PREDICTED: SID1 transmembrane family member 1-like [Nicrophorus vespilloides]|uniref:SID1 transmembrane family member 1-like n=1 Tax=Nicrophorus vespilloides TaxID=110193 RepID=A0ABM1M4D8_NICVS|nr:PREDICTED: SID1 transmembrane family member 1-like [Nicrophorus vespilloides]
MVTVAMRQSICLVVLVVVGVATAAKPAVRANFDEVIEVDLDANSGSVNLMYPESDTENPYRLNVWSDDAYTDHPVLVVVKQERRVTSWEIPLVVNRRIGQPVEYRNTSRTLCYDTQNVINRFPSRIGGHQVVKKNFTVTLETTCTSGVKVFIQAVEVKPFFITDELFYEAEFTPSQPVFFSYTSPKDHDHIKTTLINVTSSSSDCFLVSVQQKMCPVFELNDDIRYQGKYQTIKTKGGLILSKSGYPDGFFLVIVAKPDNAECDERKDVEPFSLGIVSAVRNTTRVTFQVRPGKTSEEYVEAILTVFFVILAVCALLIMANVAFYYYGRYRKHVIEITEEEDDDHDTYKGDVVRTYLELGELKLSHFIRAGFSRNRARALNYFWHICNIAIFYGIPVIQLMVSYQRAVDVSGNLDMCYHNFYCSHPFYFTDFNHIFSNVGYVIFGILFIAVTFFRSRKTRNYRNCGVPKLYGMYYAMGFALICEGFLSGCYHICPNQSNFQFDTSFMYIMAVLISVKLYQNRHPDINASAYGTFSIVGVAVLIAMFGILYNSVIVMVIFVIFYISLCLFLSFKIYFLGHMIAGIKRMLNAYSEQKSVLKALRPLRLRIFVNLIIVNIINVAIAAVGFATYPESTNFGTFLLGILLLNAVLHAIFYVSMKLICGEKICTEAIMYGVLSIISWIIGCYFFVSAVTQWAMTPAQSRGLNEECILLDFYDTHDIWHLVSAPALFFSFMFLMTLDDDVFDKPQDEIHAF